MAKKIIVHLGLHKTATTSLQEFLQTHNNDLAQKDVRYVPLQRMRTDLTPLFWNLDKNRRSKLISFISEVKKETVLLSDENIIGTPGELANSGLYPYAQNRVETFCEDMKSAQITLFLTLRQPSDFLTSMYSEYLRHNPYLSFDQYLSGFNVPGFSYRQAFGWLFRLPSNTKVRVIPFETSEGGGVLQTAREIITAACGPESGIDIDSFPVQKSRSSYSTEELELAAEIARRSDPRMSQFFLNALDAREKRFGQTKFTPLPPQVVADLKGRYTKDLQFLSELNRR